MSDQRGVVVVTGASAGVGRATSVLLAERGYRVGLLARGEAGLDGCAEEILRAGGSCVRVSVDVADASAVEDAAAQVEEKLGPIAGWINCAFASVFARSWSVTPEEYRRTTEVSYLGFVHGTLAALKRMRPRDTGVIVQVGSALAYRGIPLQAAYCGAKHAVQGFTESVRCELLAEHSGVRITMVQLPALNTPQFEWVRSRLRRPPQPVPPIYQPEVAAGAIVHALEHPRRRERWVGGSTAATLVANAVVPGLLDRYLARTGIESQQDDERHGTAPRGQGNLSEARDTTLDRGSHGPFDERAHAHSIQAALSRLVPGRPRKSTIKR